MTDRLLVAGFQAPISGLVYPTRNDARYPRVVTVHYPLHPFYGQGELLVVGRQAGDARQIHVDMGKDVRQSLFG